MKQLISGILEYTDVILVFILTFVLASLLQYKLKRLKLTPGTQTHRLLYALSHFAFPLFVLVVSLFFFYRECSANPIYSAWLILWGTLTLLSIADFLVVQISIALVGKCQIPKVLRNLVQGVIFVIILCLVIKFIFGESISILMTSSAILTGIIGFAMQGIFSNLLAGAVIHSSGRFNIGDWVMVGGHDGHITQINWSDTWITTLSGNLVSVPNASVLSSTIVNNSAPTRSGRLNIPFSASYDSPPHEVKQCLIEAALECQYTSPQHQHPPPCVLLTSYSDFAVNYELRVWITDYNNYHPAIGAINEAVWYKFKRKGIEIPFPMSGRLMENVLLAAARINQAPPPDPMDADTILVDLFNSDFVKKMIPPTALSQDQLPDLFKTVAHEFYRVTFTAGEYIFRQGEKDDETLYIFVSGKLAGEMRLADGKVVPFEPEKGCLLGEMSFLTGAPRAASIKVLETARLLKVAPSTMRKLVHEVPPLMDALSQLAVDRTQQIEASLSKTLSQEKTDQIRKSMFRRFWNVLMRDDEK